MKIQLYLPRIPDALSEWFTIKRLETRLFPADDFQLRWVEKVTVSVFRYSFYFLLAAFCSTPSSAAYLHHEGNKLLDSAGNVVRLTGVNWFGFETSNMAPHGLWARDWLGMLMQIKSMGFNCIRLPFCDSMLDSNSMPQSITYYGSDPYRGITNGAINQELQGKNSLQVMDIIIGGCRQLGLKVILDDHSRAPDGYANEMLWYTAAVPEAKWISDWVMLANRYKGDNTVVACDLNNEPHGTIQDSGAEWGTGVMAQDWRLAAERCGNAILAVNPGVLIVVEGVEQVGSDAYWWGGNLTGAQAAPVVLSHPEKLVYSAHEYGPEVFAQTWFSDPNFPQNMPAIWDKYFGYLYNSNQNHLLVGEFGILDTAADSGKAGEWFDAFLQYMGKNYSWTFWCLNPNSGDTGGLLNYDWTTVVQWKLDKLKPYMAPLIDPPGTMAVRPARQARALSQVSGSMVDAAGRRTVRGRAMTPLFQRQ